ncbi:hypothetical protein DSC45_00045 [Streptomyces sp. YIM 130001]|uniref:DUF5667 domain-containing protein n=1 Tax=Streptomyces sp. YIM 130001 TaxID=2259644 RepID=UPI000E65101C|nr:DUF5667 domain-containing protein [Streptomyces sp. YIM 130001]RII22102.1 hypothetical protein DSC45_00045 [Streptomyces sp. YIM 130001]
MIANVPSRRANAFAHAVDEQTDQGQAAEQPTDSPSADGAEQSAMLTVAEGLGELPRPELDPEVKVVQRAQLVAAMEAMLQEGTAGDTGPGTTVPEQRSRKGAHRATPLRKFRPRTRLSKGIAAGGLTVGVAAGAFSGVSAASSDALPGDSLYGLKRGMEDFKLGMTDDSSARGELYLNQASTRLHEANRLMERARSGDLDHEQIGEIRRALSGMRHDASEGHQLLHDAYAEDGSMGPIQTLSSFSQSYRGSWSDLQSRLPVQLSDVSSEVTSVFDAMEDEIAPLRSRLPSVPGTGGDVTETPESTTDDSTGEDTPTPSASDPTAGPSDEKTRPEDPSPSGSEDDGGLIGGGGGGLLDPPKDDTTPSKPSGGGEQSDPVKPDVTLPPLLPGLLPGLGISGEDTTE